jgi:hypothetical protein
MNNGCFFCGSQFSLNGGFAGVAVTIVEHMLVIREPDGIGAGRPSVPKIQDVAGPAKWRRALEQAGDEFLDTTEDGKGEGVGSGAAGEHVDGASRPSVSILSPAPGGCGRDRGST